MSFNACGSISSIEHSVDALLPVNVFHWAPRASRNDPILASWPEHPLRLSLDGCGDTGDDAARRLRNVNGDKLLLVFAYLECQQERFLCHDAQVIARPQRLRDF